jgi:hypothetical protein
MASVGEILVAARVGTAVATRATPTRMPTTTAKTTGSRGFTSYRKVSRTRPLASAMPKPTNSPDPGKVRWGLDRTSETTESPTRRGRGLSEKEFQVGIDIVELLAVFSIFFIPITGLMLILTTRFAFKPLVETLAKALKESGHSLPHEGAFTNQDLAFQIESLREDIREMKAAQEFDQKLLGSAPTKGMDLSD